MVTEALRVLPPLTPTLSPFVKANRERENHSAAVATLSQARVAVSVICGMISANTRAW